MTSQIDLHRLTRLADRYTRTLTLTSTADLTLSIHGLAPDEFHWRPEAEPEIVGEERGGNLYCFFKLGACSDVLRIASRVWRGMLRMEEGVWKEGGGEVVLRGDHPLAIILVVIALHHQTALLPRTVAFEMLGHLAVVCDKYEVQEALAPWIEVWMGEVPTEEEADGSWLFVAWALRHRGMFRVETKVWIMRGVVMEGGELELEDDPDASEGLREIYLKRIKAKRISLLQTLSTLLVRHRNDYLTALKSPGSPNLCPNKNDSCDIFNFGHLSRTILALNFESEQAAEYKGSVQSIVDAVDAMENTFVPGEICCSVGKRVAARMRQAVHSCAGVSIEEVVAELRATEGGEEVGRMIGKLEVDD